MSDATTKGVFATLGTALRDLWRVRWVRIVAIGAALLLVARAGLGLLLRTVVNATVEDYGLVADWDELNLSLFGGHGELRGLTLCDVNELAAEQPYVEIEYGVFDLRVRSLFAGELHVRRAEVDGLDAWVVRENDGTWNLASLLDGDLAELLRGGDPVEEDPSTDEEREPFDLSPPLVVEALRLQHAHLHFVDRAVEPALDLTLEANVGLSRLGDAERPARLSASVLGGDLFEAAQLTGELAWNADAIDVELEARAGALNPHVVERTLTSLDLVPVAEAIEGRLSARARVAVVGQEREELEASFELRDVHVTADGQEELALDRLSVALESFGPEGARLPALEMSGVRGRAGLEPEGALRLVGVDVTGSAWADALAELTALAEPETPVVKPPTETPAWLALFLDGRGDAFPWRLGRIDVSEVAVELVDGRVEPEARFPLIVDAIEVGELVHERGQTAAAIPIHVAARAPGLMESLSITGTTCPFVPERSVDLELVAEGIVLDALSGHLERAGVERTLNRGRFHAQLIGRATTDAAGRSTGELAVEGIALEDGGQLLGVQSIRATELLVDPDAELLRVGDLEILGTQFALGRDSSQRFFAFGLRSLGFSPTAGDAASRGAAEREVTTPQTPIELPRIELGRFAWLDSDVELVDEAADPPQVLRFEELGFEVLDLKIGGRAGAPEYDPARITARVVAPELVREATIEGRVRSKPGPIDLQLDVAVRVDGASGRLLAPYLRALGIEPTFADAAFAVDVSGDLAAKDDGWHAGLALERMRLTEGEEVQAACDAVRVEGVRIANAIEVSKVEVARPWIKIVRDEAGRPGVVGLRVVGVTPATTSAEPKPLTFPALPSIVVHEARVVEARAVYEDAGFTPSVSTELTVDAALVNLSTTGQVGTFDVDLTLGDTLDGLTLDGQVLLDDAKLALTTRVGLRGVRAGSLERLLPAGIKLAATNGELDVEAAIELAAHEAGGLSLVAEASGFTWREAGAAPWIQWTRAHAEVARVDPVAGVYELGQLTAEGLEVGVHQDARGGANLLGLRVTRSPSTPREPATEEHARPRANFLPNRMALTKPVRLELANLAYTNAAFGAEAPPFQLATTLELEPSVIFDGEQHESLAFRVSGHAKDIVESWSLGGAVDLYAEEPKLEATFDVAGLRTPGVIERLPELAGMVQGELDQAAMRGALDATFFVRRQRPAELGLGRPFSADLRLSDLHFTDVPGGRVLAGVDGIACELKQADLAKGFVHVEAIEIERPRAFVRRSEAGIHALGFALLTQVSAEEAADSPDPEAAEHDAARPATPVAIEAAAPKQANVSTSEFRIDEVIVQGVDLVFRDEVVSPPVELPIRELDAEIARFSTRMFTEPKALRFAAYLGVGNDGPKVFDEIAVTGRTSFFPKPKGWAQLALDGVELEEFAPWAELSGLTIEDGALDANVRMRLKGSRGARVATSLVFTDLDFDELEGGVVSQVLSLPMALETALVLLRNASGEHRFSVGLTLDEGGISTAEVVRAGVSAFTEVLASALASAPLRLLGTVVPFDAEGERERLTWTIPFRPGVSEIEPSEHRLLDKAAARARSRRMGQLRLRHELTARDLTRVETLANPTEADLLDLIAGLRRQRQQLAAARPALAREARALHAVAADTATASADRLRAHDAERAAVEAALDHLLEVLRNDSPRHRDKRTKATARELADLRLHEVERALLARLPLKSDERIEVRSPRFTVIPGDEGGRVVIEFLER